MHFRQYSVAISGDIETMFYQVKVPAEQRDLLRFLWWTKGDFSHQPKIFRMTVHLFGAGSSPSCANYGLQKTATDNKCEVSIKAVETVKRNFYMDDVLKSVETIEEAKNLVNELKTLCNEGGFNLTKWTSNRREVLVNIPVEERAKELRDLDLDASPLPMERTLGILWSPEVDEFQFRSLLTETEATRRAMLSIISSVYDPLGFISPLIIPAKMLLQEICKKKAGWDDKPDNTTLHKWKQWTQNIKDIQ
ncbi:uncharacterized protein LOC117117900 [Anneissia japonica]|uniref:uncharacterized protein LOC117117900 n=1 Tax=Anneissia japonica TaxID=1529436 RepID=UPI0014254F97|nr:uncharacterized protein LOC117117900 [Anneissia japonica]